MINIKVILLSILCTVVLCVDYCEIEKKLCGHLKHLGCEKNHFNETTVKPFTIQPMTETLKRYILNELNTFRSNIAIGKYEKEGLPKAANMRSMRWNDEFGYLVDLSIKKTPYADFTACVETEEFRNAYEYHFSMWGIYSGENLFRKILRSRTIESTNKTFQSARFFGANNHQIACAFGSLLDDDGETDILVKFIQNDWIAKTVAESYDAGTPCSKCFVWNEDCDNEHYPGLCVPKMSKNGNEKVEKGEKGDTGERGEKGEKGLKGDKGDQGVKGDRGFPGILGERGAFGEKGNTGDRGMKGERGENGKNGRDGIDGMDGINGYNGTIITQESSSNFPITFWILYSIMGCGVIISILLSLKVIPNYMNKRSIPLMDMEFK